GNNAGATGIYNLSNGASLSIAQSEKVGSFGDGTFNQTGGMHVIGTANSGTTVTVLAIGASHDTTSAFNLSGGTLNVIGRELLGGIGHATFNQTGGDHVISGELSTGIFNANSLKSFNLSGGNL